MLLKISQVPPSETVHSFAPIKIALKAFAVQVQLPFRRPSVFCVHFVISCGVPRSSESSVAGPGMPGQMPAFGSAALSQSCPCITRSVKVKCLCNTMHKLRHPNNLDLKKKKCSPSFISSNGHFQPCNFFLNIFHFFSSSEKLQQWNTEEHRLLCSALWQQIIAYIRNLTVLWISAYMYTMLLYAYKNYTNLCS